MDKDNRCNAMHVRDASTQILFLKACLTVSRLHRVRCPSAVVCKILTRRARQPYYDFIQWHCHRGRRQAWEARGPICIISALTPYHPPQLRTRWFCTNLMGLRAYYPPWGLDSSSVVTNTEKKYWNTFKYFIIQKYLKYYLNTQIPVKYLNTIKYSVESI